MARILVVEDDTTVVGMLELVLSMEGHETEFVVDGAAAITRLDGVPTDLVILDVMIPEVDGIGVLKQLRANDRWADTKVIVASALASDEDLWRGWSNGADYYLVKPYDLSQLRHVVTCLLEGADIEVG